MKRSFPQYASTRAESADNAKASSKYGKRDAKRDAKRDVDDGDDSVAAAPTRIRLMSWNVDMDTEFKHMRTRGVIAQVRETRPDVVMLQEVTSERISETTRVSVLSLLRSSLCPSSTNDEVVEVIDSDSDGVTEVKKSDKAGTTVKKRAVVSDDDDEVIVVSDDPTHEKGSDARQLSDTGSDEKQVRNADKASKSADRTASPSKADTLTYEMHLPHATEGYFCVLLIRRGLLRADSLRVRADAFGNSAMMRGLICVHGRLSTSGGRVAFLTSHLESLPIGSERRKAQFAHVVRQCREFASEGGTAIFAGDTNLREREISAYDVAKTTVAEAKRNAAANAAATALARRGAKRSRVEPKLGDAWVMAGCPDRWKFTWDTVRNDNLTLDSDFKPRARYDRAFMLGPELSFPRVAGFRLLGTTRLSACGKFISDHFGVLVDVDVLT